MAVRDLLMSVQAELGDPRGERYTHAHVLDVLNDAMAMVYQLRPSLFSKKTRHKMTAGAIQTPCGCQQISKVEAITDAAGNVLATPTKMDARVAPFSRGCNPCANGQSVPRSWGVDQNQPGAFVVDPPVSGGEEVYAEVWCPVAPEPITSAMVASGYCLPSSALHPIARHYMLARLFATETESSTAKTWHDTHYSAFNSLMGIKARSDQAISGAVNVGRQA